MNTVTFDVQTRTNDRFPYLFAKIQINHESGLVAPTDLQGIEIPAPPDNTGIVFSGHFPIWGYAMLAVASDRAGYPWIACHSPRDGGAIVIYSKVQAYSMGDLIPIE